MTFEHLAGGYFGLIALIAPLAGAPVRRFVAVMLTAFGLAASTYAATRWLPVNARLWTAPPYLATGYWLPALLVTRQPAVFDAWLRRTERVRGRSFLVGEAAYLSS